MMNMYMIMKKSLIFLPTPINISSWWNMGFMLGMTLSMQLLTGFMLSLHYCSNSTLAFTSIVHITRDVNYGWLIQLIHMNGASLFFILIYIHVARGIYFSSYLKTSTWLSGFVILVILMLSAFLGYVLPWGQMSFWGATVITNLLSAIPYIGNYMVYWIWGGFSVDNATLSRFFIFHFILPFTLIILVILHLMFLHVKGSNNPLGTNSNLDKIPFHPFFFWKDFFMFSMTLSLFFFICLFIPFLMTDSENFIMANPMTTPIHIQPEWYFLFAYAILRSIPNKLGGVMALMGSLMILLLLPMTKLNFMAKTFSSYRKSLFWYWLLMFSILTFIGAMPVEDPFIIIGQTTSILYFTIFLIL